MGRLDGRVIIVTGGGQGIGRAMSLALATEGAKLAIADIDRSSADAVASEIGEAGGDALAVVTDVSDEEATRQMAKAVVDKWGRIDGLVNNAAMFQHPQMTVGPIEDISAAEWDKIMAVNLRGPFLCCKAVIGQMKSQNYGKIVNMSSGTFFSGRSTTHYVASKGGVIGFTRVLAKEVGDWKITVNTIAPGLTASDPAKSEEAYAGRVPFRSIKRIQRPDDLTGAAIFLMSSESDFMTGQTMVVDGGAVMH